VKPIRKTRHALMFMGAGALGAYFLDPEAGPQRRERLMDQIRSVTADLGMGGSSEQSSGGERSRGGEQSSGAEQSSGSDSGESASPAEGSADAFADAASDSGSSSAPKAGSGPIDLATGEPVSESPLGA
jgi:hypothetical protein